MKKILLLSDNHGYVDEAILHYAKLADEVWHAGDWLNLSLFLALEKLSIPVRGVYGNADGADLRAIFPLHNTFNVEGLNVYMTHIGGKPGKYSAQAKQWIRECKPHLFICGHSHILQVSRDKETGNMLFMNPGACGLQGFHKVRTALRFGLENGKVCNPEIIEFGKR